MKKRTAWLGLSLAFVLLEPLGSLPLGEAPAPLFLQQALNRLVDFRAHSIDQLYPLAWSSSGDFFYILERSRHPEPPQYEYLVQNLVTDALRLRRVWQGRGGISPWIPFSAVSGEISAPTWYPPGAGNTGNPRGANWDFSH